MSFSYARGQINPVVNYYYDAGARQRFSAWHVVIGFMFLAAAMTIYFAKMVTSNLQLVSAAESPTYSLRTPTPTPAVVAPISTAPDTNNLQTEIDAWIRAHKGVDWAVSVEKLDGGLSASVNPDQVFSLASIYKLFLLQPLAQKIPSSQWSTTKIESKTYASCVDAMLRVSDNACAEAIGASLGWTKAQNYLRSLGYGKTTFLADTTTGTVNETAALLKNLYQSEGFDELARTSALQAMLAPKKTEGIRHGCDGCTVYNKIGDLAGYHNDAAIIEKNGKAYSVVIFSKTGSWEQIAELTKIISAHF
jgi:beta-lactamase class A